MIKYHLKCECGVEFESWFSNSQEYDNLERKNLLSCQCGKSKNISKQIMSPQIASKKELKAIPPKQEIFLKNVNKKLRELRNYIEKNSEYVGDNFVSEARSIHYDKKNVRSIYGKASPEQTEELLEEGIEVNTIPWINKSDN
tara:strand:+ start:21839 stop:22264 length:426 start_codon:yes stop_codon:yes gene_type:complete